MPANTASAFLYGGKQWSVKVDQKQNYYTINTINKYWITWVEFPEVVEVLVQASIVSSKYVQLSFVGN